MRPIFDQEHAKVHGCNFNAYKDSEGKLVAMIYVTFEFTDQVVSVGLPLDFNDLEAFVTTIRGIEDDSQRTSS